MRISFITFIILLLSTSAHAAVLQPFTTDGCSAFPNGTLEHKQLWLPCCTAHDVAYWQGGTYDERLVADEQLYQCVSKLGELKIAELMLTGVRFGGNPYLPTTFRWGYGWSYLRGYKALSIEEKTQVKSLLNDPESVLYP
jgi:hypothetical protein